MRDAIDSYIAAEIRTQRSTTTVSTRPPTRTTRWRNPQSAFTAGVAATRQLEAQTNALQADDLDEGDWEVLKSVSEILAPLKDWTIRLQAKYGNGLICEVVPAMHELLSHFEAVSSLFLIESL